MIPPRIKYTKLERFLANSSSSRFQRFVYRYRLPILLGLTIGAGVVFLVLAWLLRS